MIYFRSIIGACLLFCTTCAFAAEGIFIDGGVTDCGEWVVARKEQRAQVFEGFVIGMLGGMALGRKVEFWQAGGVPVSRDAVYLWMDNYCNANPLSTIVTGIVRLFNERTQPKRKQ